MHDKSEKVDDVSVHFIILNFQSAWIYYNYGIKNNFFTNECVTYK